MTPSTTLTFIEINGFEEIYCMALDVLDSLWVHMDAKYMDFPRVLQLVKHHVWEANVSA